MKLFNTLQKKYGGRGYGKYLPMRWFYKNILPLGMSSEIKYEGGTLYIGEKDTAGYSFIPYEVFEREVMRKNIKEGDIIIDIGANVGFYTLLFSKWVGEKGMVYAFEPEKTNFKILKHNVETNRCSNVVCFNLATSDIKEYKELFISDKLGEHSFASKTRTIQICKTDTIDNLFRNKRIDFIKMDIEGWEYFALKGMKKTIKFNPQVKVFSEFYPSLLKKSGISSEKYIGELKSLGFKVIWINQNKNIKKLQEDSLDSTHILCLK